MREVDRPTHPLTSTRHDDAWVFFAAIHAAPIFRPRPKSIKLFASHRKTLPMSGSGVASIRAPTIFLHLCVVSLRCGPVCLELLHFDPGPADSFRTQALWLPIALHRDPRL